MSTPLAEHIVLLTNAASRAARECTALVRRLEGSDDLIALRNALPNLITSLRETCGISYSLGAALSDLDLPPSRPGLRCRWVSDHYYLSTCAHVLEKICAGARVVPGFEAGTRDAEKAPTINGDPAPTEPLTAKAVQFFLLDLARLKGRLRTGCSSLDMYSLHAAVSQPESINEAPQNGLSQSHLPEAELTPAPSLTSTQLCLECLNHPSENRRPLASHVDEVARAQARNKTNPAYPRAATTWITPLVNTEWKALREPVLCLFGLGQGKGKPARANLVQWVLEFTRQTWPHHYDNRLGSGQPRDALAALERRNPELPPLVVAAAFGLSELCREFLGRRESINTEEWSIALLAALLGPSTLLKSSTISTWERINEPPFSIAQRETIRVILTAGFATPRANLSFCLESPQPAPPDYLAFLVSLRLRDSDLFFSVLTVCDRCSDELKDLLQPGPFWGVAASRYEPCASDESRAHLSWVLIQLIQKTFPVAEETPPLSALFPGSLKLAMDLDLPFTSLDIAWRQTAIPDARFAEEARGFVRDENTLAIRCLVQDPRWDPNLPYKDGSSGDGCDNSGTILHMAAESSETEDFEILELIVQSGADLERTDQRDRTAVMLCEAAGPFRFLVQQGANTLHRDVDGRNCWHFAAANVDALGLIWLHREDPNADRNMRARNNVGLTPLAEAILSFDRGLDTSSAINCILYLCAAANGDLDCVRAPIPILHAAVRWGSEEVVRELIRLGVDPKVPTSDGSSPLHQLNFSASPALIYLLQEACTDLPLMRPKDKHSPIETMFLNYDPRRARPKMPQSLVLSSDVVLALLTPETLESKDNKGRGLWERFCCDVVDSWGRGLKQGNYHAFSVLRVAIQQIARTKALRLYEEETGKSGIPLFYQASQRMTDGWPTDIIISVYKTLLSETTCLDRFVIGSEALDLAGTGVAANALPFLDLLLKNGVSVHQRPPSNGGATRRTLLEIACAPGNRTTAPTFEKLLEYADPERLDDVDDTSQGLIHNLILPGPGRDQKLTALLDKGASPDLLRWGRSPALVSFILERQHDAAMILLENGANPALATKDGMDAALASASRGSLRMLEKIKSMVGPEFDWERTCKSHFTIIHPGGGQITTTASNCNALHLAAFNGFDIIVQFYCFSFNMDVNHAIVDNMNRPVHLAAIGGSAPCIRVLHEHGADLTLRAGDGFTALHTAVRNSQVQAVKTLLEIGGAKLNTIVDNEMLTPFMHALQIGFPNVIKLFTDVGTFTKMEASPSAARSRFIGQTIEMVIRSGDLVQCKNLLAVTSLEDFETCPLRCEGCSPVMLAIREGKLAVLRWLLDEGCTGLVGACPAHFRRHMQPGYNALLSACGNPKLNEGLAPLLSAYLANGIDWTTAPISPVHAAARAGNLAAIKIILQHMRSKDLSYRQRFCFEASSPHRNADRVSQSDMDAMTHYILNQRVTARDIVELAPGWTPLHVSTSQGHDEVTRFLLQQGADVHAQDDAHDTPLHIAVKNGNEAAVRILLRRGAHRTRAHGQGFAPLMAAVESGNVGMADVFVRSGADTDVVDMDGMSLLNIAGERPKSPAAFHYLSGLGLDPYARDKAGYMAFDDLILNVDMLGYVLNRTFDFSRMRELSKGLFSLVIELNRGDGVMMLKRLLRRLPRDKVRAMVDTVPKRFVSPLCAAVYRDILGAIDVLIQFGADVNVEGSAEGTPLMTACSRGRLQSVRMLVGHGARVAYVRDGVVRSAVDAAGRFPEIQRWLLVGRYTERRALGAEPETPGAEVRVWSGPWTAAHRLQGSFGEHPRSPGEARVEYLARTAELRRGLAGRVLRGAELVRPSGVLVGEVSGWDVERVGECRVARGGGLWRG